jgi:transcriptional regulator with XRE-family HTH domain
MKKNGESTLGQRLRKARIAAGLSQEDVGDGLGVTRSAISQWEKEQTTPGSDKLVAAAEMLGVDIEWLRHGVGRGPRKVKLKNNNYRRSMMNRMQRMIATGKFDDMLADMGYVRKKR